MTNEEKQKIKLFLEEAFWYHTIDFPEGMISNGLYDHRDRLDFYGFSKDLKGKKVLDVGAADGFFSFELEKMGAEVLAIDTHAYDGDIGHTDISPEKREKYEAKYDRHKKEMLRFKEICDIFDIKTLNRLLIAKSLLHSRVEFEYESIYNLASWNKKFDLVVCGDLIEHLKDPLGALENLVSVTGEKCIITLSSSQKVPKNHFFPKILVKGLNKLLKRVGMRFVYADENRLLEYYGNVSGGSFFHFYPGTFREAALASGFKKVEIFSEFDVKSDKRKTVNHHTVFHCYV